MDETVNPLTDLPAELLDEMDPGQRLVYLAALDETPA